ncbi:MAG: GNAT family N-acetyltransferase [bacterium]
MIGAKMAKAQREPPKEVVFRAWTRGDIPALARLAKELYLYIESIDPVWRTAPGAEDVLRAHLTDLYTKRYAVTYLAVVNQEAIGFITGSIVQRPPVILPHRDGLVDNAYVKPPWRNKGIGARLCNMLMDWFVLQGIDEVRIHYQVSNREAAAFWERMGFLPWTIEGHCIVSHRNR